MIEKKNTLLSIAVAMALTACGGGGGSSTPAAAPTVLSTGSGTAVDGYVSGATVVCDTNKNGVADAGEVVVLTDAKGNFVFSPACTSNIVVSGGTNIDTGLPFTGVLKAPAGSTVATPLTSLMVDSGLTAAQIATSLGLPAGTDLTTLDPAATNADGSLKNPVLQQKTLAVQQIIQQTANTIGMLAQNSTSSSLQAIYSEVVKAVAASITANPTTTLIDTSGTVSGSLVTGIVQQSVTNVATSANTKLATVKNKIAGYSATSVAEVAAAAITSQAQTLATTSNSNALTKSLQSDVMIANAVNQVSALLTTAESAKVDMTAVGAALKDLTAANTSGDATAKAAAGAKAKAAVTTQATNAGVVVTLDPTTLNNPTNYLSILNDQINLNGTAYTLGQFTSGLTVTGATQASLDTVGFTCAVNGTPVPADANGVKTTTVGMGLELTDATGRVLQVEIDTVTISVDASNKISISVPATAKVYIYGKTASGVTANITLNNVAANSVSVDTNNAVSFNMGLLFSKLLGASTSSVFTNLQNVKGTFNVKFVMSTLDLRTQNATPATGLAVSVTGSGQPPVSGLGVQGIVTIQ
jgi:hypothetical protein